MTNIATIVGNATGDAELRFTPSGAAVCNFTIADTPRVKQGDQWIDGETMFTRCTLWRDAAENAAESITKGMRLIVTGKLKARSFDDKQTGQKRTVIEMDVDEVGPSLRWASAKVAKADRKGRSQAPEPAWGGQQQPDPWSQGGAQTDSAPF